MPIVETAATKALEEATANDKGRSAGILVHDGPLRQTILALMAGQILAEHNSPAWLVTVVSRNTESSNASTPWRT